MTTKGQMQTKFAEFDQRLRGDLTFASMGVREQSTEIGVSVPTILSWRKKINWEEVSKSWRVLSSQLVCEAEIVLRKRMNDGDLKAVELVFARHDNWVMKSVSEVALSARSPEAQEDTEALILAGLCSLPLDNYMAILERSFRGLQVQDRQAVLSRLGALDAEVVPYDYEHAGRLALPAEIQNQLTRAERGSGDSYYEQERPVQEWGDSAKAVPQ